jgi:teichuronic acid biosynthesis glycosyltransferase TuaC
MAKGLEESPKLPRFLPMRILVVTNMLPTQDDPHAGRFIQQQIEALRRIGLDIDVLLVNRREEGMRAYASLPARLRKAVARFKPDLIHVMYGGIMSRLVCHVVRNRPVVVTFHGSDLLGQPFERPLRRFFSACGVIASRQAARRCEGIVAVAEHLLKRIPKIIPSSRIQIIPCGIDLDLFKPIDRTLCRERLGWTQDTFYVLFQNTGDPVKRPELAQAAVDCLKALGVNAELRHLRGVSYDQVPIWLNASDVLLVTSHHEGSPTIVKEALACDLPIVSVRAGDIPQRIQKIEGCHLSAPDATELAVNLQKVWMNPGRIEARETVRSVSADHCAHRISQFYAQVLGRGVGANEAPSAAVC